MGDLGIAVALVEVCRRLLFNNHQRPCSIIHTPMSVKISPKFYATIARGQTWQGRASCLRKTQSVERLEELDSPN